MYFDCCSDRFMRKPIEVRIHGFPFQNYSKDKFHLREQ
jgi:hypothetical protein